MAKQATNLFPLFPTSNTSPAPEPSGIARLAAESSELDHGHLIQFRSLNVRSLLNDSVSRRGLYFAKSINPYRGCEFGCKYCYARYTHEFMELKNPMDFESKIFLKQNAAWLLQQELRQVRPGEQIALGTATDPYQPIERRTQITRSLLEVFAERRGFELGIVTKSTLIERDIDLLQRIAARNELVVHVTITTTNAKLARILEPRAPRPDLRFRTVSRLRAAGLRTGILCSPLLPGITDNLRALDSVAKKARAVDASFFASQPLFLKPCSRGTFLEFVREHFPHLEASYRERYESGAFVSRSYQKHVEDMVHFVVKKHGLAPRSLDALLTADVGAPQASADPQALLWPQAAPAGPAPPKVRSERPGLRKPAVAENRRNTQIPAQFRSLC